MGRLRTKHGVRKISKRAAVKLVVDLYSDAPEYLMSDIMQNSSYKGLTEKMAPFLMKLPAKTLQSVINDTGEYNVYVQTT